MYRLAGDLTGTYCAGGTVPRWLLAPCFFHSAANSKLVLVWERWIAACVSLLAACSRASSA